MAALSVLRSKMAGLSALKPLRSSGVLVLQASSQGNDSGGESLVTVQVDLHVEYALYSTQLAQHCPAPALYILW